MPNQFEHILSATKKIANFFLTNTCVYITLFFDCITLKREREKKKQAKKNLPCLIFGIKFRFVFLENLIFIILRKQSLISQPIFLSIQRRWRKNKPKRCLDLLFLPYLLNRRFLFLFCFLFFVKVSLNLSVDYCVVSYSYCRCRRRFSFAAAASSYDSFIMIVLQLAKKRMKN